MFNDPNPNGRPKRLIFMLGGMLGTAAAMAASAATNGATTAAATVAPAAVPGRYNSVKNERESILLRRLWGIDDVHVRSTASGSLVQFSYRVLNADKAKILNSKDATPYLVDEQHGLALQIPVMEQVGQLRQVAAPQNGRDYWMAFSNKGKYLKPGNHVTLIVGNLRISGLVVE
jgi:hypothetical protein